MKNHSNKLRHEQKTESTAETSHRQQQQQSAEAKTFSSAEEVLRHEAAEIVVPPAIATRLNESLAKEPQPSKSWWKRLFS